MLEREPIQESNGHSREEIMKASKINSKATYNKCMKELELLRFMVYDPTSNPHSCSNINISNFSEDVKTNSKSAIPSHSKNEHVIEQVNEQLYI